MIGKMDQHIMDSFLETLPIEFSILDSEDKVLAWNKHDTRIFKRHEAVIGRDVRRCHPSHSLDKVETIIKEMKSGERDKARFWIDLEVNGKEGPQKILIEYYALRDGNGKYLGCMEVSQNITEIQKLTGSKRLLD
ncbi:MAG: PAS domain-containing protein [Candidatus Aminicenantes bacterium]|nr:PAS domain-containing protein [Candidatus Aminicenantes bacterium]